MSFSASGLYKLYTIASPTPNSVSDRTVNIFENKPSIPKYSFPNSCIKNVLATNATNGV